MKNVFQALVLSTVASVMFSCSNGDSNSINLPDEALPKGELHVDVKSGETDLDTKPNVEVDSETAIRNLHLFVFKNMENHDDNGKIEHYAGKDLSQDEASTIFSVQPTQGYKDLIVVANLQNDELSKITSMNEFFMQKALLTTQVKGNFTMVGEQRFQVNGGLNETTINLTRLVSKVVLKSVSVVADLQDSITPVRAFMMNVSNESWLRGSGISVGAGDPIAHGYNDSSSNYMAALTADYTANVASNFYVFENRGATAKTMLCIEAEYLKKSGEKVPVYYSIVVKTGDDAKVLRNNVYTLSATIKRPGSLHPEIPSDHGDLEVSITVDPWETNAEQEESFE